MTDVQTEVGITDEMDAEPDAFASPEEAAWWEGLRDIAYEALLTAAKQAHVADELGITYRTLYNWRHHPYWRGRFARDQQARAEVNAALLLGIDEAALDSLRGHVAGSGHVAFRYALARGLLARLAQEPWQGRVVAYRRTRADAKT